jgi:hypothetical protein
MRSTWERANGHSVRRGERERSTSVVAVGAGVLVEHGTGVGGIGRSSRLYVNAELLGLTGSNPLRG